MPTAKKPTARTAARTAVRKPVREDGRVKATFLISAKVDYQLSVLAARDRTDRSTLATAFLERAMERYKLDQFAEDLTAA